MRLSWSSLMIFFCKLSAYSPCHFLQGKITPEGVLTYLKSWCSKTSRNSMSGQKPLILERVISKKNQYLLKLTSNFEFIKNASKPVRTHETNRNWLRFLESQQHLKSHFILWRLFYCDLGRFYFTTAINKVDLFEQDKVCCIINFRL